MAGQVFTILEAAQYLFGDQSRPAYYRTRRVIQGLEHVKHGRTIYIAKSTLDKAFGITGVSGAGGDLRVVPGAVSDAESHGR